MWLPQLSLDVRVRAAVEAPWHPPKHVMFATHLPFPPAFPAARYLGAKLQARLSQIAAAAVDGGPTVQGVNPL